MLNYSFAFHSLKPQSFMKLQNSFQCAHTTRGRPLFLLPPVPLESSILRAGLLTSGPVAQLTGRLPFILSWESFPFSVLELRTSLFLVYTLPVEQIFKNVSVKSDILIFHSQLMNSLTEGSSGLNFSPMTMKHCFIVI